MFARSSEYLLASVVSSLVAFATLPVTTRVLGATEYGIFALAATIAGFGASLSTLGATFVINRRWPGSDGAERRLIVSTLARNALLAAAVWSALALVAVWALRSIWEPLGAIPLQALALMLAAAAPATLWIVAVDIVILDGRSRFFAGVTVAQALAVSFGTLVTLYVADLPSYALFVGAGAANVVAAAAALACLRSELSLSVALRSREQLGQWRFLIAQMFDSAQPLLERALLTRFAGFAQLGFYSHSQSYRSVVFQATNAVSRGAWPTTVAEARVQGGEFRRTGATWAAVAVGVAALGIPFVLFGSDLTARLTNGKLTAAADYFGAWFILILLQCSGRSAAGVLYTRGRTQKVANLNVIANGTVVVAIAVLVPFFGAPGAAAALLVQAFVYRVLLVRQARAIVQTPFQDGWIVMAVLFVGAAEIARLFLAQGLVPRLGLVAVLELVLLVLAGRIVQTVVRVALSGWRTRAVGRGAPAR